MIPITNVRHPRIAKMNTRIAATVDTKVAGVTDWTGQKVLVDGRADLSGEWMAERVDQTAGGPIAVLSQGTRVVRVTTQRLKAAKGVK